MFRLALRSVESREVLLFPAEPAVSGSEVFLPLFWLDWHLFVPVEIVLLGIGEPFLPIGPFKSAVAFSVVLEQDLFVIASALSVKHHGAACSL